MNDKSIEEIKSMADIVETLDEFKKRFDKVCFATMLAEKTIAALKTLEGYGYYTCVKDGKKIFVTE